MNIDSNMYKKYFGYFPGWPKLQWMITESLGKAPRDWEAPGRLMDDLPAYIEYTSDRDGHVMGVSVPRNAMIKHCRALTSVCGYTEGEVMVSVVDFKRDVGLWHSVLTVCRYIRKFCLHNDQTGLISFT